jgi:uncharacterized protein (TIRG00374 family)
VSEHAKRYLLNAVKYGIGLVLLAWMIWRNWAPPGGSGMGLRDAFAKPIQFLPLGLAAASFTTAVALTFLRWYVLVHAQDLPLSLFNTLRLGLLGFFWNTLLPGSIGGDIVKATYIAREQSRRTVAVATVLIDRALGLWGIILVVALLGGTFWISGSPIIRGSAEIRSFIVTCVVIVAVTVCVWLLLGVLPARRVHRFAGRLGSIPKIGHSAAEFWLAVWLYRSKRSSMAGALLLSLGSQFFFIFTFYFAAQIFHEPHEPVFMPDLREQFILVPIGVAAQTLPLTPGGMGVGQAVFGWLYGLVDESMTATGVLASIARDVIAWSLGFVGYLVYLRMRPAVRRVSADEPAAAAVPSAS